MKNINFLFFLSCIISFSISQVIKTSEGEKILDDNRRYSRRLKSASFSSDLPTQETVKNGRLADNFTNPMVLNKEFCTIDALVETINFEELVTQKMDKTKCSRNEAVKKVIKNQKDKIYMSKKRAQQSLKQRKAENEASRIRMYQKYQEDKKDPNYFKNHYQKNKKYYDNPEKKARKILLQQQRRANEKIKKDNEKNKATT